MMNEKLEMVRLYWPFGQLIPTGNNQMVMIADAHSDLDFPIDGTISYWEARLVAYSNIIINHWRGAVMLENVAPPLLLRGTPAGTSDFVFGGNENHYYGFSNQKVFRTTNLGLDGRMWVNNPGVEAVYNFLLQVDFFVRT